MACKHVERQRQPSACHMAECAFHCRFHGVAAEHTGCRNPGCRGEDRTTLSQGQRRSRQRIARHARCHHGIGCEFNGLGSTVRSIPRQKTGGKRTLRRSTAWLCQFRLGCIRPTCASRQSCGGKHRRERPRHFCGTRRCADERHRRLDQRHGECRSDRHHHGRRRHHKRAQPGAADSTGRKRSGHGACAHPRADAVHGRCTGAASYLYAGTQGDYGQGAVNTEKHKRCHNPLCTEWRGRVCGRRERPLARRLHTGNARWRIAGDRLEHGGFHAANGSGRHAAGSRTASAPESQLANLSWHRTRYDGAFERCLRRSAFCARRLCGGWA